MKIILIVLCSLGLMSSCKNNNDTNHGAEEDFSDLISTTLPEDFNEFYNSFQSDSSFQMNHIVFPLLGKTHIGEDFAPAVDTLWQAENWIIHKAFNDMGGTYQRTFTNFKNIISEEIADKSGQYLMIRRFSKIKGEWNLIYYKSMGPN